MRYDALMVANPTSPYSRALDLLRVTTQSQNVPDVGSRLDAIGFASPSNIAGTFQDIVRRLLSRPESLEHFATFLMDLRETPAPTSALMNFLRYLDTSGSQVAFLRTLADSKPLREILTAVFGCSQYMSDIMIRNPGYLYWLIEQRTWDEPDTHDNVSRQLRKDTAMFGTLESRLNAVRRFHRRGLLKIGVKDLLGVRGIEDTTLALSNLADAVVGEVLIELWNEAGTAGPTGAGDGFCVLALGKLGGRELNYSSDIDLIYLCEDCDDSALEFYHKLARRLTAVISDVTGEGYLYRVDLRLRPDGRSGPLVNSTTSMRIYYENRGRPWEFQALLKARVIAGDVSLGEEFLRSIAGLTSSPSSSYSPVDAIALMRTRIRSNISAKERAFNIKLMEGGIRDIEFIVQTLQLLHGHRCPRIRVGNTIDGIDRLYGEGLIDDVQHGTMLEAYRFFRLVEHRLQMMHQFKTHSIPESPDDVGILAGRVSQGPLGRYDYDSFLSALSVHLNKIRLLADRFFEGEDVPESSLLLLLPEDHDRSRETLAKYGMQDTAQALSVIQSLAYGSFPDLVDRQTRSSFERLLPTLLSDCARGGDPGAALVNFSRVAAATRSKSALFGLLAESAAARELLLKLTATSSVLTGKLGRNVEILDTLFEDPSSLLVEPPPDLFRTGTPAGRRSKRERLQRVSESLPREIDRRVLAAWVRDIEKNTFPRTLRHTLAQTIRSTIAQATETLLADLDGVAVLAFGSFGIGEPRLRSDVDLLVVTHGRDIEPVTRKIHELNQLFARGGIKLDFRLRGEGANAPLVQDLDFYRDYLTRRASSWERVAFGKCSFWAGDHELAGTFDNLLTETIDSPFTITQVDELIRTRRKVEALVPNNIAALETKRSSGGRYDIEYMCSLGLNSARVRPVLNASTGQRLAALENASVLAAADRESIGHALAFYERVEYLLELGGISLPKTSSQREKTIHHLNRSLDLLGCPPQSSVDKAIAACKREVRRCYDAVLARCLNG